MTTRDQLLAELHQERYGDPAGWWREQNAAPLDPPTDGPRDWWRRQTVLLDALEDIPQNYRRGWAEAA